MSNLLQIGELAKQTGRSIRTLRYYDEICCPRPHEQYHSTQADIAHSANLICGIGFAQKSCLKS
ncbi:MerR family DNA-binding transcriptional regulator [Leptolyngbya iicbica]